MSFAIKPFSKSFYRSDFDCGYSSLNHYIKKQVSQDISKKLTACFVLVDEQGLVKGYYTLSNSSISQEEIPEKYSKQVPPAYSHIPVTLLGRLAIDRTVSGQGYGKYLLIDALKQCYETSLKVIGSMAVVVDPMDKNARLFYERFGFLLLPGSGKMFLPMKTVGKLFSGNQW